MEGLSFQLHELVESRSLWSKCVVRMECKVREGNWAWCMWLLVGNGRGGEAAWAWASVVRVASDLVIDYSIF